MLEDYVDPHHVWYHLRRTEGSDGDGLWVPVPNGSGGCYGQPCDAGDVTSQQGPRGLKRAERQLLDQRAR